MARDVRGGLTSNFPPHSRPRHLRPAVSMSTPYHRRDPHVRRQLRARSAGRSATASCCPISENDALFNLIGTTYGGDGQETFELPDLRGRIPIHMGQGPGIAQTYVIGEKARRGDRDAHRPADPGPHPRAASPSSSPGHLASPANAVLAKHRDHRAFAFRRPRSPNLHAQTACRARGRQPAARQHAALPVRELHHFALRHLPDPDLSAMADPFLGEIRIMLVQLRARRAGRCATGSSCRSTRTRRSSRCWARRTAATAQTTFALPDLRGRAPMHVGAGVHRRARRAARSPTRSRRRDARPHAPRCRAPAPRAAHAHPAGNAARGRARRVTRSRRDAAMHAATRHERRRQPAAREPARRTSSSASHRPAGHLPVAELGRRPCPIPSSPRSASSRSTSRPRAGRMCNGQLLPISQNTALFSLLGTTYGGDGKIDVRAAGPAGPLPDAPRPGPGPPDRFLGETGGTESVTLLQSEMPLHSHFVAPGDGLADVGRSAGRRARPLARASVRGGRHARMRRCRRSRWASTGSSFPHNNLPPYLVLNFVIALQGIFPARN